MIEDRFKGVVGVGEGYNWNLDYSFEGGVDRFLRVIGEGEGEV